MADLKDIFSDDEQKLRDEELLKYVEGNATEEEMYAVEKKLNESSFESEAVEGLQSFDSKQKLDDLVQHLNKNLHQQLAAKKQRKDKRDLKTLPLSVITVIIILAICVIAFIAIQLFHRSRTSTTNQDSAPSTIIKAKAKTY